MTGPVVVGTDLSDAATEAIRQGGAWANRVGASLLIVHAAPDKLFEALESPRVTGALSDRASAILGALRVRHEVVLDAGSPHGALVRQADRRGAELIVVGSSGAGSVERALFGSTAQQVVRYAHCPVLVARPSPANGEVLVATDFSVDAERAVQAGAQESARRDVGFHLVHSIYEPSSSLALLGPLVISAPEMPTVDRQELRSAAEDTLASLLESTNRPGKCDVLWGPPAPTVAEAAMNAGASLVVVATRGRTGLARVALGSVAEEIVRRSTCSVLAVRREGARKPE